jgi:hypothetical protein
MAFAQGQYGWIRARAFTGHKNIPLNREAFLYTEQVLNASIDSANLIAHSTFKPMVESEAVKMTSYQYFNTKFFNQLNRGPEKAKLLEISEDKSYIVRKLRRQSLIILEQQPQKNGSTPFYITIDPLFNLEAGKSNIASEDSLFLYVNTRGLLVRGDIGKKFSFESTFYENQAVYTGYISEFVDSLKVAPGQGRVKKFKSNGYDFAMSGGYISFSPSKHINLQFGHGKHFVGNGYRSLLLSDNSFNYPYVRATSTFGKFQYVNLYTVFMNLSDGGVTTPPHTERLFQKKAGSFQMLSYAPHKRIHLGLFQGMIWDASDTRNRHHLNAWYFNPVIGLSAVPLGLASKNNILFGATMHVKATKGIMLYSQFMMDDVPDDRSAGSIENKTGWQAGFRAFNLFTLPNLHLQAEYNSARPYSYSHRKPGQSYTHYNQPLAHPLGANFNEAVGILSYRISDLFAEVKVNYAKVGRDSAGYNLGGNPLASNNFAFYGVNSNINEHLQGLKTTITNKDLRIGYMLNPSTNMNIVLGATWRELENAAITSKTIYYYVAFRTSLNNTYYDF